MRVAVVAVVAVGLVVVASAHAGQLHIQHYGLKEARQANDTVLVGKVVATQKQQKSMRVTLDVTRVFAVPVVAHGAVPKVGDRITRELYGGVEWTDPHKSPLDRRLRNALRGLPADGATVVLVPSWRGAAELLPFDDARLRTLQILYSVDVAATLRSENDAQLELDLKNEDLAELARGELKRRGKLSPFVLLQGDENELYELYRRYTPLEKAAFVRDVLPALQQDGALRRRAARVVLSELWPDVIAPTAQLVNLLDWKQTEDRHLLDDVRLALIAVANPEQKRNVGLDLSPYADYLYEATIRRPDYRQTDEELPKLLAYCDAPTKSKLAARFLQAVYTSERARGDDGDAFVLDLAVELAKAAPSSALWEPLQKLRVANKPRALTALLEIGSALAKHDPSSKERVRELVEPQLTTEVNPPDEIMKVYREFVGTPPRGKAIATTVELGPKQWRRLASGERITVTKQKSGDYDVEWQQPDGTTTVRTLAASGDWYREWWIEPYRVVVKRVGDRVNLQLVPAEKDPAAEPAALLEMAKKICERRGGRGAEISQDPDDATGVYTYEIKGKNACKVRLGMRTKTMR